jgi:hypothetical protein
MGSKSITVRPSALLILAMNKSPSLMSSVLNMVIYDRGSQADY